MPKANFFRDKIHEQFLKEGNAMYSNNSEIVLNYLNTNDQNHVLPINIKNIEKGRFYFMFYDLQGKTSKLEKFNTILALDWVDADKTRWLYGISINFMPVAIRTIFFNTLFNQRLQTFNKIEGTKPGEQDPLVGVSLGNMYKSLKSIGFEWAIRKFDIKFINKAYLIDWNIIHQFITMSTARLTGVDDGKLIEIWKSKLSKQQEREKEFVAKLIGDYTKMAKELETNFQTLYEKEDNLNDVLTHLKNITI